ncbi:kinetochore-associated protein NSL1 homolog [Sphaeramia orbicularis]|uniref:NSL1 component of MIS12 kinetochore complex n=1 Tax=Sphaeramia orbicularis TaxID=375764 RepID=A0A672YRR6_9TELE|nr:kinetochore-associated protein NSL1 homolog [Sphaeramia orbicularis]
MESEQKENTNRNETDEEFRVQVTAKTRLTEQISKYKDILRTVADGQTDVPEDIRRVLVQELLANFEAAVQDNVLVNGKPWSDAPDDEEDEAVDLEIQLDDAIVETSRRRRTYPRTILPHVVHALKAERKLMGLYENTVKPQEAFKDPDQEDLMGELSAAAPLMVKEATELMKSIMVLQTHTAGLCQVLDLQPSPASVEIHREVLGRGDCSDITVATRQPIRRAVEEAVATQCYVPVAKKPKCTMGE